MSSLKNILIVGSRGFIGSAACEYLKKNNYNVFMCDVYPDPVPNYFCIDMQKPDYSEIFVKNDIDAVIFAAGSADVSGSLLKPDYDFLLNTQTVYAVFEAIRIS
jgi:nucleoside-diphosphate-sugar epimerase